MVARDYAAYVRNSTGKEDRATVGFFCNPDVHRSIFFFEESPEVFKSLKLKGSVSRAQARCDEYKSLLELQTPQACKNFCAAAREDIGIAIKSFRSRDPQNFPPPPLNRLPNAEPVDGEIRHTPQPSSSEVRVSPTPGRGGGASTGEGSTSCIGALPLEVQITVNDFPIQTLLLKNVPPLTAEELFMITKEGKDIMDRRLRELIGRLMEELDSLFIRPESIPALE